MQACGLLNVAADECLFVGDGGTDELLAAKALGMTTVHMIGIIAHLWPERIPERAPYADYVIESIPQLLSDGRSGA